MSNKQIEIPELVNKIHEELNKYSEIRTYSYVYLFNFDDVIPKVRFFIEKYFELYTLVNKRSECIRPVDIVSFFGSNNSYYATKSEILLPGHDVLSKYGFAFLDGENRIAARFNIFKKRKTNYKDLWTTRCVANTEILSLYEYLKGNFNRIYECIVSELKSHPYNVLSEIGQLISIGNTLLSCAGINLEAISKVNSPEFKELLENKIYEFGEYTRRFCANRKVCEPILYSPSNKARTVKNKFLEHLSSYKINRKFIDVFEQVVDNLNGYPYCELLTRFWEYSLVFRGTVNNIPNVEIHVYPVLWKNTYSKILASSDSFLLIEVSIGNNLDDCYYLFNELDNIIYRWQEYYFWLPDRAICSDTYKAVGRMLELIEIFKKFDKVKNMTCDRNLSSMQLIIPLKPGNFWTVMDGFTRYVESESYLKDKLITVD